MDTVVLSPDDAVKTLVNLGLTILQAKVYLALAKIGTSTGKTTAKAAKVASQDVYRVLGELQERGLVEKVISKPSLYRAISVSEGLAILLQNKEEEYRKTEKEVKAICNSFCEGTAQTPPNQAVQFVITSQAKLLVRQHEKLAGAAKESIDFIAPLKMNEKMVLQFGQYIKPALRRGVKIRVLTHQEETIDKASEISLNPLFDFRVLPEQTIPFGMHIFDRREITLAVSKQPTPSLWTNNPHIVRMAEAYFESLWSKVKADPTKIIESIPVQMKNLQ